MFLFCLHVIVKVKLYRGEHCGHCGLGIHESQVVKGGQVAEAAQGG